MALSKSKGVQKLQVMGDSQLVIDWFKHRISPRNIYLRPLYEEVKLLVGTFQQVIFYHIYKERNSGVDILSKDGLHIGFGLWHRWEFFDCGA